MQNIIGIPTGVILNEKSKLSKLSAGGLSNHCAQISCSQDSFNKNIKQAGSRSWNILSKNWTRKWNIDLSAWFRRQSTESNDYQEVEVFKLNQEQTILPTSWSQRSHQMTTPHSQMLMQSDSMEQPLPCSHMDTGKEKKKSWNVCLIHIPLYLSLPTLIRSLPENISLSTR